MSSLDGLDATLRGFISLCAAYHHQYLQTPIQLDHACTLLLNSDFFSTHSDRMSNLLISDTLTTTDPHEQLILHHVLLLYGRRHHSFFRSHKKWGELILHLMDHIVLVNFDAWGLQHGTSSSSAGTAGAANAWVAVPIEAKLRVGAVRILYEVCRVQKFDLPRLEATFGEEFVDQLFEMVENTRDMLDETLNYCLIKLIIALNEQWMVASLPAHREEVKEDALADNRVLQVLMRRLGSSKTFAENLIFMLNRADSSAEDRCMQLLVLKILYLLFTTPGTQEFFYTNDLCVLVDVFIRELADLDDNNESLRHTYLRVLHPLLTHTQLRTVSHKRAQILRTLESLVSHAPIRDINPTTKRLVERCLGAEWAVQLRRERVTNAVGVRKSAINGIEVSPPSPSEGSAISADENLSMDAVIVNRLNGSSGADGFKHPLKDMKFSKSMDALTLKTTYASSLVSTSLSTAKTDLALPSPVHGGMSVHDIGPKKARFKGNANPAQSRHGSNVLDPHRRGSNDSSMSLMSVAGAGPAHGRPSSLKPSRPPSGTVYRSAASPLALTDGASVVEHGHDTGSQPVKRIAPTRTHSSSTSDLPSSLEGASTSYSTATQTSASASSPTPTPTPRPLVTRIDPSTPIFEDPPELVSHEPSLSQSSSSPYGPQPAHTPMQSPPKRRPAPAPPTNAHTSTLSHPNSNPPPNLQSSPTHPHRQKPPPPVPPRELKAVFRSRTADALPDKALHRDGTASNAKGIVRGANDIGNGVSVTTIASSAGRK